VHVIVTSRSKGDTRCAVSLTKAAPLPPAGLGGRIGAWQSAKWSRGHWPRSGSGFLPSAVSVPGGGTLAVSVERLRMACDWPGSCWHGARGHVGCPDAVARARRVTVALQWMLAMSSAIWVFAALVSRPCGG